MGVLVAIIPKIPLIQFDDEKIQAFNDQVRRTVNALGQAPDANWALLTKQKLVTGSNTIPHTLGRNLSGWLVIRQRGAATLYDTQDTNQTPALTLLLTASAPVVVDLKVF